MSVLLTGATGFLGSRLCASLLRRKDREIVCVVRAPTVAQADERVRSRIREQDPDVAGSARLNCVPGDITEAAVSSPATAGAIGYPARRRRPSHTELESRSHEGKAPPSRCR
ncbi:SDR family oxidoreductase [Streptomyces roseirectus]|uniref:SDR family oxidoreductase n=1 Tax=Streptomyces roseirectus TaxID=2768066 RepID=A0A7H0I7S3_9ACTN|nr:SDR family oxidoreductase [Streptomyces roseirectus]QNP68839.1 SDR family oxidoreductase [Streptomyces roseirectus]